MSSLRRESAAIEIMAEEDVNNCCVAGCRNKLTDPKLCFFSFPLEVERQNVWLRVIGRPDLINRPDFRDADLRVCSKHFTRTAKSEVIVRKLLPDAVPTKFLPTSPKLSIMHYDRDDGISDVATQTDITYGFDRSVVQKDEYVEVDGKKVLLKKEKDPEIPKLNTFVLDKPIKKEPDTEDQATGKKTN